MDWNTLLGVVIGGLIATLGNIINNRFQSQQRDKDRVEAHREASIQAKEKWIERDVLRIMDSMEKVMQWLSAFEGEVIAYTRVTKAEPDKAELKSIVAKLDELQNRAQNLYREFNETWSLLGELICSFDDPEMTPLYNNFVVATNKLMDKMIQTLKRPPSDKSKKIYINTVDEWAIVRTDAGKLHQLLREKLISIRE